MFLKIKLKIIEAQPENREFKLEDVWEFVIRFINSEEKYEWKRQLSWWFLIYKQLQTTLLFF